MRPDNPTKPVVAFIGGGNMAGSMIGGLVTAGWPPDRIRVAEPLDDRREALSRAHGIHCSGDSIRCIRGADLVILAVKPQVLREVVLALAETLRGESPLLISIAAGIRGGDILSWVGGELPFVRVMPNTPALVNRGISGLWANALVGPGQRAAAEETMRAVGEVVWVEDESLIDTVTGVSGSGPAYFFKLMELMMEAAQKQGLDSDRARTLVLETAAGAATLIRNSDLAPAELRRQVTSPGGTTEAGIRRMEDKGLDDAVLSGIDAAVIRSRELSDQFGGD